MQPQPPVALDGRDCGFTNQGQSICFDGAGGGKIFASAQFGAIVDCQAPATARSAKRQI